MDGEEIRNSAGPRTVRASEPDALRSSGANGEGSGRRTARLGLHGDGRDVKWRGHVNGVLAGASVDHQSSHSSLRLLRRARLVLIRRPTAGAPAVGAAWVAPLPRWSRWTLAPRRVFLTQANRGLQR